jgi:HPt (histidine-containing phosphotransfer) domain-containing protein
LGNSINDPGGLVDASAGTMAGRQRPEVSMAEKWSNVGHPIVSQLAHDADMAELIEMYIAEMPARAEKLGACISARDWKALTTIAHQLRGSAGGHGFPTLGACAGALEDAMRTAQGREEAALGSIKLQVDVLVAMCRRCVAKR